MSAPKTFSGMYASDRKITNDTFESPHNWDADAVCSDCGKPLKAVIDGGLWKCEGDLILHNAIEKAVGIFGAAVS